MSRRLLLGASLLTAVLGVSSCGREAVTPSAASVVTVSQGACAAGWSPPTAGRRAIRVRNNEGRPATVSLIGSDQERAIIDPQSVKGHGSTTLRFVVAPGTYAWRCQIGSDRPRTGALFTVAGAGVNSFDAADPPSPQELSDAVDVYRAAVSAGIGQLVVDTDSLVIAVASGNSSASRAAWLTAHLDYLRLGAAYGTFGDHDAAINGSPQGLPGGLTDPSFTGFYRLEAGLWGAEPVSELVPIAQALDNEVHSLHQDFPSETTPVVDLPLRAHEILENGMQFDLTGEHDGGSQSDLASVGAEVDATHMVLAALAPALEAHAPAVLSAAGDRLDRLTATLAQLRRADGTWPPVGALTDSQRGELDGATGAALEQLSHVPVALELVGDGD